MKFTGGEVVMLAMMGTVESLSLGAGWTMGRADASLPVSNLVGLFVGSFLAILIAAPLIVWLWRNKLKLKITLERTVS
jgi:preprotein translocase subunit SecF